MTPRSFYFRGGCGPLSAVLLCLLSANTARAEILNWNGNGSLGGNGTWNTDNTANWWNGSNNVVWPAAGGTDDDAVFGGTAGTVTITNVTANGLTFNTTGYTLASGTLTLNGTTPTITAGSGISAAISSTITGSSGLTKAGLGTLTLSGANTYTGATRITGGTVSITADANLGSAPVSASPDSSIVLDSGTLSTSGTFTLDANRGIVVGPSSGGGDGTIAVTSGELTYNGIITSNGVSGTGGLIKSGTGTLTLGGSNTYAGNTTISAGTLKLGSLTAIPSGLSRGDVSIAGTLDLNGYGATLNGLSGAGGITTSAAGSINLSVGGNNKGGTYTGIIANGSGTIGLTKIGTGTITLGGASTFSGGVTIDAGTLQLGSTTGLGAATNSVTFGASAPATTKLQLNGYSATIGGLATNATPGTVVVENASASNATLTVNQAGNTTFAGVLQNGTGAGTLGLTKSGAGTLTLTGINTFTGTATISAGTLALSGGSAIADGAAVSLANTSGAILLLNANETIGSLAGGGTTGGNVNLQGFTLTTGGTNTDTAYGGTISGTGSLIKTGSGLFTLSRANTYTGSTSIKNGQIVLGIDNALAASTVLTLGDGTTNASGVLKLNNYQQTLAGLTTAGSGTGNRVINDSATTKTLTLSNTNNYSFSGILGGTTANENNFNLVKSGAGTMTLSGANTYSGTTTVNAGTLSVGNISSGLGSGASAIALSGGTLSYTGNNASFTRGFTVSASGGQIDTTTAGQTLSLSGVTGDVAITSTGNFTVGGAGNTSISTNITGTGGILNKTGTGTLTLSGANSYTGATNIRNGTLILGVNNGVSQGATLTLGDATANTNGVLRLNGFSQTLSGLSTTGAGTVNSVTGGSSTLSNLTVNSGTFGGIFGGSGTNDNNLALTKSGTGTLTLSGTSTYTGGTTITDGILSISNNAALGGGTLTFNGAGATLQLSADISASSRVVNLTTTGTINTGTFSMTTSGKFTGTGGLTKAGTGTLTLSGANDYEGLTSITNGTLALSGGAAILDSGAVSITNFSGANLLLNANETIGSLTGGGSSGGNINLRAYTLTVGANDTSTVYDGVISGTGALSKTGTGTLTLSRANTYTGSTTISSGTLALSGGTAISNTSAVVLSNTAGANLLLNANETIGSLAGGGVAGGNVNLQSFTLNAGGNNASTSYAGVISGTGGFTKSGTGTTTFTGSNSYTGTTTIKTGTLALSGGTALADSSAVSLDNATGAILLLNANETIGSLAGGGSSGGSVSLGSFTLSAGANDSSTTYSGIISGTGGLTKVGTGALTLARSSTYTGTTTISAGTLIYGTDSALAATGGNDVFIGASGTLDINGRINATATLNRLTGTGIVTNNNATTANLTLGGNNTSSTFNGSIQNGVGLLRLTKTGTGTVTLTPDTNNSFTGNITINNGALQAGNNNAFNSSGSNVVTFGSNVAIGTKLQVNGNAVTIAGLATPTNSIGSPVVENANVLGGTLTIANTVNYTYAGVIQDGSGGGALSLVKNGVGSQTLSGPNTYTGSTQILGGTLSIRADTGLGTAPASATAGQLMINGGTLQTTTNSFTLAANRGIALGSSAGIGSGTFDIGVTTTNGLTTTTYGGIIANNGSGTGGLVKIGLGNLALSGAANTYSGGTTINAGLLSVTTTAAGTPLGENIDTNNIAVNVGGNLSLSSTLNKGSNQTITVNSDATGRGGIGFSDPTLGQDALNGLFTNNTGSIGGVLGINSGITYATALNLATFGSGENLGKWFLGSASGSATTPGGIYSPGTLGVGSDNLYRLGGGGGALTISTASTITGANNVQVGFSGLNGNGIVTFNAAQSYTGTTTVTGGAVLAVSNDNRLGAGSGAGNIVLDGGTLRANTSFTLGITRGIALGSATGSGTGTLDADSSRTLTYGGIITDNGTGADNLAKTGSGTVVLTNTSINTYTGSTEINGGILEFTRIENLGAGTAINFGGGILRYAAGNITDITSRTVSFGTGGGTINTNGNDVSFANATQGTGSFSKTGAGTLTLNAVNAMGNVTVGEGTLKMGVAQAIPATSQLILNSGATTAGTFDVNGFDMTVTNLTGLATSAVLGKVINSAVGTSKTLTTNVTSTNTFAGILADNNGTGGTLAFNKTGSGILILSGPNTYTGGTTISAGTLAITADASLGGVPAITTPGNLTIASGATLGTSTNNFEINANRGIAINGNTAASISVGAGLALTYNGVVANTLGTTGGLTKSDTTGTLILGGANTYAGTTTVSGGTLKIANAAAIPFGTAAGNVSVASANSGRIDLNGYNITINGLSGAGGITSSVAGVAGITVGANDQTSTYSGAITDGSGTVNLGKTGTGILTLSGSSTYTGTTTITSGKISVSSLASGGNLGSGTSAVILGGESTWGALYYTGNDATFSRGFTVNAGGGEIESFTTGRTLTLSTGGVDLASGGSILIEGAGNTTITSVISGSGGVTKAGVGTLNLSGINSYSGNTEVQAGTLQVGNAAAIPSGTGKGNLSLASGTTLDLNNQSPTVNGLTGSGTVTNSQTGAVTFTAGANNATSTFSGIIQNGNGTVAFTKTGAGKLTLSGANTYSGDTTIDAGGILEIANITALPSGSGKGNVIANGTLDLDTNLTVNGLSGSGTISTDMASAIVLTTGANDQTSTFAGNIVNGSGGGSLGLTKTGAGTLTLSGGNTYSGATTISAGTLKMGSATGLSSNSTLTISGPAFLDINGNNVAMDGLLGTGTILNNGLIDSTLTAGAAGGSTSFGGVIADGSKAISLNKSGAGTLTLTGINTYSGTTTIANGAVSVANIAAGGNLGSGSAPIILGDAINKGTLSYTGTSDLTYTRGFTVNAGGGEINTTAAGKTLTLQGTDITTAGTFTVSGAGNALVQSVITGAGGLTKANTGSMILSSVNTYTGDTTISTGTLQVTDAAAIPSGTGKGNVIANGTLDVNNLSLTLNGLSGSGIVTNTAGSPVTLTLGGNDASANFTGIIQDGSGVTSLVKTGAGIQTLGGANTYSGDTTISEGTLRVGNAAAIPSGASMGDLTVSSGGTLDLNDFEVTLNRISGTGLITNDQGTSTLLIGDDQSGIFEGNIQDGLGTIGLTKIGTGVLTLSGNNTFSGDTLISQGTLSMGSDTGLSPASTLTIGNAGALDLNGRVIAIDGLAGTGSITNNSATDVLLTIGSSGGSGTFAGTINDGAGVIGLVKTGAGTVTLSNVNTYSGHTTVTGGLLAITSYGALGEVPATVHPANIMLDGGGILAANTFEIDARRGIAVGPGSGSGFGILAAAENQTLTYNGIIANNGSGTGGLTKTGLGTLTLGGVNTYSGDTTISSGALQIGNTLALPSGFGKGNLILNATLDLNNTSITVNGLSGSGLVSNTKSGNATLSAGANNQTSTFAGIIENGNGLTSLTKVGTGTLTLAGTSSTYTGTTAIAEGTLSISQDANLGDSNSLIINAGATLAATDTFTLDSTRGIAVGASGSGIIDVLDGKTLTYGGVIANNGGTGGFTKSGTGTLILTGNSTYTGTTTVDSGVLTVNGNIGGSGATVVKTGATLNGTGITGAMDVLSDGTLQPGDGGIGTLTVSGHLSLAGIANFELGTPGASHASPGISDRVDVTGDVVYGGTINLIDNANAGGNGSIGAGSYKLITYTGSASGSFAGVTGFEGIYHDVLHDVAADKALYIDLYNYAVANITLTVDLGRIHAGGTFGTQSLTVANSAAADDYTESLGGVFGTTAAGFTSSGSVTGIAGQANNASNMVVGISDNTAGQKTGLIGVNFTSQAVSGSGLSNTALADQTVTVNGFAYSGQSTWNAIGGGSWGNNTNDYSRWDGAGGTPGLDGALSVNDTATFGNHITAASTVTLDGANPSLKSVTFDSAAYSYTLAQGTSGSLTLKGNGAPAQINNNDGDHTISAPVDLATSVIVSVTSANDTLTISGAISGSGNGITKTGDGTLVLLGHSSYTGASLVSAGTLLVNGSLGNTSTTIAFGATLSGTGLLNSDVTINGNIDPGEIDEIGTIGASSLYINQLMSIAWNGTTNTIDKINIANELMLGGSARIVFTGLEGTLTQQAYVFANYGSLVGPFTEFNTVGDLPAGYIIDYHYGAENNQLALVAIIPEPGFALLGGVSLLTLLRRRRSHSSEASA